MRFLRNFVLNIPSDRVPGRNPFALKRWAAILVFQQAPQAFRVLFNPWFRGVPAYPCGRHLLPRFASVYPSHIHQYSIFNLFYLNAAKAAAPIPTPEWAMLAARLNSVKFTYRTYAKSQYGRPLGGKDTNRMAALRSWRWCFWGFGCV
jgi:hypothetical protein